MAITRVTPSVSMHPLDIITLNVQNASHPIPPPPRCVRYGPAAHFSPSQIHHIRARDPTLLTSREAAENGRSSKEVTASQESNKTQRGGSP